MRVVVIGGTTFIGPRVVERLRDHEVTLFHRGATCGDPSHIHDDRANIAKHALRAEVVIDMIAMSQGDAETLVESHIAPRLVVLSSGDVYRQYDLLRRVAHGRSDPLPLREDAPLRDTSFPYGGDYEKILVERVVMREPGATVLRLGAVYGPGDPQDRFAPWRKNVVRLKEDYARWRWTRAYVDNVADAIVLAATNERAAGRIYNVGEPDAPAEREWVEQFARARGRHVRVELTPEEPGGMPSYDWRFDLVMDTGAIRNELGYRERVTREDAMRLTT
jgi:nucleoside-diphosphate-sugar epimerase